MTNKAAERLRTWVYTGELAAGDFDPLVLVDKALAAERRATVERIRERLLGNLSRSIEDWIDTRDIYAILDEEAAR